MTADGRALPMTTSIPLDYHMHSRFSSDSQAGVEEMCRKAIELGIPEIGLSEHFDLHPREPKPVFYQPDAWWAEIEAVRSRLDGRLTLRAGIEIGEPHRFPREVAQLLGDYPYDYVIGSLHYVGDDFMFDENLLASRPADEILLAYFNELEVMTRQPQFDILGHLDVPVRNAKILWGGYEPQRYERLIRAVLQNCIDRKLALDVNAAGLRKPARNLMPDAAILRWYVEMGGQYVTFGSDAHSVDQIGLHLDQALQAVRQAGLKSVAQFERRQARLLPLE